MEPVKLHSDAVTRRRILIATPFDDSGIEILREAGEVDYQPELDPDELESVIGSYHALVVSSEMRVPDRTIEYAYQLQVIGVTGSSLDHLNVSTARSQDVEVVNVPDSRTLALAEETMRLILSLSRKSDAVGLAGKRLGIIGFGGTGHEVARRARAFDMRVLVHQPRLTPELALDVGAEMRELHALLAEADFISLHVPPTTETWHLIGAEELSLCRPSTFLINTSNPEAVDLDALLDAVEAGRLAGAALVAPQEKITTSLPASHPNIQLGSPVGPSRTESSRNTAVDLARHVVEALKSRWVGNPLSLRVVPVQRVVPHEHYDPERVADLAERLKTAETLVNPPVVVEWENMYIVLDGATRATAFKQLDYAHLAVQVVSANDDGLQLHTWYHAVSGPPAEELLEHLQSLPEIVLTPASRDTHQAALKAGQAVCTLITRNEECYLVQPATGVDSMVALNAFVAGYIEVGRVSRTLNTNLAMLKSEVPEISLLVIFPQFTLEDVLQAAVSDHLLPAGITRFLIPGRVLRLHASLERLRADEPLASKNAWLNQLLADKLARRRVRYYQEPVFLLDE